jgi:molecular chaperone HscC
LNGILEVESTIVSTGKKAALVIERSPGVLGKKEVAAARKAMQRLKFHPREALPNVTATSRADALYVELRGVEREMLGHAINSFRAALETQDDTLIGQARAELIRTTENLTAGR